MKPLCLLHLFAGLIVAAPLGVQGAARLAPTTDVSLEGTDSVAYAPTLQLAWEELRALVGGPVLMPGQTEGELLSILNGRSVPAGVVPGGAFVAVAGFTHGGVVHQIEESLERKFGREAPPLPVALRSLRESPSQEVVTYAFLYRALPFPVKFDHVPWVPLRFEAGGRSSGVKYFGCLPQDAGKYSAQVEVVHYSSDREFTIALRSKVEGEFIVLAKPESPDRLSSLLARVAGQLAARGDGRQIQPFGRGDTLAVPVVDLKTAADFPQLCRRPFSNQGFEGAFLHQVYQDVMFRLDEGGAVVRSTAYGRVGLGGGGAREPGNYHFDRPFLVSLWMAGAQEPYLAVWVASSDVLVPVPE